MSLSSTLRALERMRDASWRQARASSITLRWRALTVRHSFHLLPGESLLEVAAGSGAWTEQLARATGGGNPITAVVFDRDLAIEASRRHLPNTRVAFVESLDELPDGHFDYIVGHDVLEHEDGETFLAAAQRLLGPGGQLLVFESNGSSLAAMAGSAISRLRRAADAPRLKGVRARDIQARASRHGFTRSDVIPTDILPMDAPPALVRRLAPLAFVLEHAPVARALSGSVYVWLTKQGHAKRPRLTIARHAALADAVSVVIPCHNEEMNVRPLADALRGLYAPYIHEIIFVDDNSTDRTAEVVNEMAGQDSRVRLVRRTPPSGVGRALRDGYAAATGPYILTMDCDFVTVVPELRDLFDQVAAGHDGAIGSRFSHESVLVNYPFFKIVCNRAFHLLLRLTLVRSARDLSNNLKLYRAEILKSIEIASDHFAANLETGLRPLLAGYDVVEVPISWVNRTPGMGVSSFRIAKAGPEYVAALVRILSQRRTRKGTAAPRLGEPRESPHRG